MGMRDILRGKGGGGVLGIWLESVQAPGLPEEWDFFFPFNWIYDRAKTVDLYLLVLLADNLLHFPQFLVY